MSKLALFGGPKVRSSLFPSQNTYDHNELTAVKGVMESGRLSHYRGNWGEGLYGGPEIQTLELEWSKRFNVRHAICCNSATSGLHIALGALGINPGDEVIVSPYSMTCSATMPLAWGAVPVFADVEKDCFCLDYDSVLARITEKTAAIIAVSLFGQPFDPRLRELGIPIIEDAAQALGSKVITAPTIQLDANGLKTFEQSIHAGNLGDIGVYSFNYGKHLTCGEGGMVVTNDDELAFRCRLIMNHGEAVINDIKDRASDLYVYDPTMFGFNLRMTELQAAIIRAQLRKLDHLLGRRIKNAVFLQHELGEIPAIAISPVRDNCTHTYYALPFLWDSEKANGLHRDYYIKAVKAELTPRQDRDREDVQIGCGYIKPIYCMPIFNHNIVPSPYPNVEKLWRDELFLTLYHAPNSTVEDMLIVADAFIKVWENREELI